MTKDNSETVVKGNANKGILWNQSQYLVENNGDKIGTFGNDITFAEKVFKEKTGRDI